MTLVGQYVDTFAAATHALPEGMHMNADYPFMLAKIKSTDGKTVTIIGRGGETATATIERLNGIEWFWLSQSSSYERMFRRKPQKFRFAPFRETL